MYIVNNNMVRVTQIAGIFFKPGENELSDIQYSRVKDDRQFRYQVEHGKLSVSSDPGKKPDSGKKVLTMTEKPPEWKGREELKSESYTIDEMEIIVIGTIDPKALALLRKGDDRKAVHQMIKDRLEELKPPKLDGIGNEPLGKALKAPDMVKVVEACESVEHLEYFKLIDDRKSVNDAIDAQLLKLNPPE